MYQGVMVLIFGESVDEDRKKGNFDIGFERRGLIRQASKSSCVRVSLQMEEAGRRRGKRTKSSEIPSSEWNEVEYRGEDVRRISVGCNRLRVGVW